MDRGAPDAKTILVSGNIEAHESILSFKSVLSRIVELPFDEGKTVTAGTVLAKVDDADYKQEVVIAQAGLDERMRQLDVAEQNVDASRRTVVSDEAEVSLRELEFGRAQTLVTKGAGTIDTRDVAETALKQARAALERDKALEAAADKSIALAIAAIETSRANLDLAKIVLGYTTLVAPFDGVILVRQAELGEVISPGARDRDARRHQPRVASRLCQRDRHRQDPARAGGDRYDRLVPGQGIPGPDLLHRRAGGVHARRASRPTPSG